VEQRGWERAVPDLDDVEVGGSKKRATCLCPCEGGELTVHWVLFDHGWQINSAELPELVVGDIHEGIAAFQKAWASSGSAALVAMIRPESNLILRGGNIILKRREWGERRLALGKVNIGEARSLDRIYVTFDVGARRMRITPKYWLPVGRSLD
jgi:hypothetical protein